MLTLKFINHGKHFHGGSILESDRLSLVITCESCGWTTQKIAFPHGLLFKLGEGEIAVAQAYTHQAECPKKA